MYFKSLIYGLDNLPERNDAYREELENIKNKNGIDTLYQMLKESDPKYAKQVNMSDEKRIIRALEVFKASGNNFSSMVGYKNKDYLASTFSIHQFGILDEDRLLLHSRIEERLEMIGELTGKIAKWYRKDNAYPHAAVMDELGDVLWFVSELARQHNLSLSVLAQNNLDKLASRMERGTLQGSGDNR